MNVVPATSSANLRPAIYGSVVHKDGLREFGDSVGSFAGPPADQVAETLVAYLLDGSPDLSPGFT
jgi:hypothetical protein